ncbi:hypothetical protein MPER_11940 [Moniliophthora perniciosa FA553]|nr:hypothetical protein MPER_11940 [Moniliophthora perniciosa FA553]
MAAMPLEYFERNGRRMVRLIEPPPESTPVTREWLEECGLRYIYEEIRQRRLIEQNEDRFTRHMIEHDRISTELRYKGQIARSLVNKGFPRSALQVDLRQRIDNLEKWSHSTPVFRAPNSTPWLVNDLRSDAGLAKE